MDFSKKITTFKSHVYNHILISELKLSVLDNF